MWRGCGGGALYVIFSFGFWIQFFASVALTLTIAPPSNHPNHGTPQTSSTRRGVDGGESSVCGWVEEVAIVAGTGHEELVGGHA